MSRISALLRNAHSHKVGTQPAEPLVPRLHQWLNSAAFEQQDTRKHGGFHPSALYGACRRALAYEFVLAPRNKIERDPRLQLIFEVGHGVHDRFQRMLAQVCKAQGLTFTAEVRISRDSNPWFVIGSADGVIAGPEFPKPEGVELKTINKDNFNRLYSQPKEEHVHQGNLYLGFLNIDPMHYIYICKDNSALKEFIVPFNQEMFEQDLTVVEEILLSLQVGKWPARCQPDCHDVGCAYHVACWSGATIEDYANETTKQDFQRFRAIYYRNSADVAR